MPSEVRTTRVIDGVEYEYVTCLSSKESWRRQILDNGQFGEWESVKYEAPK